MHTEKYCKTLNKLSKKDAIRAIHEAFLQLDAIEKSKSDFYFYNNAPVLNNLKECLIKSGHVGFVGRRFNILDIV